MLSFFVYSGISRTVPLWLLLYRSKYYIGPYVLWYVLLQKWIVPALMTSMTYFIWLCIYILQHHTNIIILNIIVFLYIVQLYINTVTFESLLQFTKTDFMSLTLLSELLHWQKTLLQTHCTLLHAQYLLMVEHHLWKLKCYIFYKLMKADSGIIYLH